MSLVCDEYAGHGMYDEYMPRLYACTLYVKNVMKEYWALIIMLTEGIR